MNDILKAKIGFGTYKILDQSKMDKAIEYAIKNNYSFIDTAKLYGTEELIANAIKKIENEKWYKKPIIQSKIWPSDFKNGVENELRASLKRLNLDKIDCFMLHRPHVDMTMNVKAWRELIECKEKGLVDVIGVSNFDPDQIRILYNETKVMPEINQIECSVTFVRKDRIVHAKQNNIVLQGWRPFGDAPFNFKNELIKKMAEKYKCSEAQIMIAFSKGMGFCPIPRSDIEAEIIDNIKGLNVTLDDQDLDLLERTLNRHESTTHNKCDTFANLALDDDWYKTN